MDVADVHRDGQTGGAAAVRVCTGLYWTALDNYRSERRVDLVHSLRHVLAPTSVEDVVITDPRGTLETVRVSSPLTF